MFERKALTDAVKDKSRRVQLEAVRDWIASQLETTVCKSCDTSRLRTGDQAALILRLTTVLKELEDLPDETASEKTEYEKIQERVHGLASVTKISPPAFGTKNAPRQQGGRIRGFRKDASNE